MTAPFRQRIVDDGDITHRLKFDSLRQYAAWAGDYSAKRWSMDQSRKEDDERTRFTGTQSFEHALHLVHHGWKEGRQKLVKGVEQLALKKDLANAPAFLYDVAGSRPEVPLAVAGDPCCMWNANPLQETKAPVLRFIINNTANCSWKVDSLIRWGACVLSVVDSLEANGQCSVELSSFLGVSDYRQTRRVEFTTLLKRAGTHIDFDIMAFAIAHPSMFRRIGFAAMERVHEDDMEDYMGIGYGRPWELPEESWEGAYYVPGVGECGIDRRLIENRGNEKQLFEKVMAGFNRLVEGKPFAAQRKQTRRFDDF